MVTFDLVPVASIDECCVRTEMWCSLCEMCVFGGASSYASVALGTCTCEMPEEMQRPTTRPLAGGGRCRTPLVSCQRLCNCQ